MENRCTFAANDCENRLRDSAAILTSEGPIAHRGDLHAKQIINIGQCHLHRTRKRIEGFSPIRPSDVEEKPFQCRPAVAFLVVLYHRRQRAHELASVWDKADQGWLEQ